MIEIRRATVHDLQGMQVANLTNLPENYTFKYYLYHALSWPHASYVAVNKDENNKERVIGYVFTKMEDEIDENQQKEKIANASTPEEKEILSKPHAHITSLSVMRTYRRMGLAAKLMRQSLQSAVESYGAQYVSLHVRKSNTAALHLYKETLEFEVVEIESGYYADGEDAYSMRKNLSNLKTEPVYDDDEDLLAGAVASDMERV